MVAWNARYRIGRTLPTEARGSEEFSHNFLAGAATRRRLNAMSASTSQAALTVDFPPLS